MKPGALAHTRSCTKVRCLFPVEKKKKKKEGWEKKRANYTWKDVGRGGGRCAGGGGKRRAAVLSECLFIRWRRSREGGSWWCKIYLLLSENFDPGVVNLSKESSQLNRKHEKEGGGGGWRAGRVGVAVAGGGTPISWSMRGFVNGGDVYNLETDSSQPVDLCLQLHLSPTYACLQEIKTWIYLLKKLWMCKDITGWKWLFWYVNAHCGL